MLDTLGKRPRIAVMHIWEALTKCQRPGELYAKDWCRRMVTAGLPPDAYESVGSASTVAGASVSPIVTEEGTEETSYPTDEASALEAITDELRRPDHAFGRERGEMEALRPRLSALDATRLELRREMEVTLTLALTLTLTVTLSPKP